MAILAAIGIVYCLIFGLFALTLFRQRFNTLSDWKPVVSVIVAARNEEKNIGACLESLAALHYPRELLEVIIVDDCSEDATPEIVIRFMARLSRLKLVATRGSVGHLRGKTAALAEGVEHASGEVLFFTDADCRVPATWIEGTLQYYRHERTAMVAGFTYLPGRGMFERLQALDWFTMFSAASAAATLGFPVTAVGNNLSIRRSVYDAIGGYRNIDFSVTEDLALVQAVTSYRNTELCFPVDDATLVESRPCSSWGEWYRQRKRWFIGGRKMKWGSQIVMLTVLLFNLLLVWSFFALPLTATVPWLALKIAADTMLVIPALRRFRKYSLLLYGPFYQVYFAIHVIGLTLMTFFQRSVTWKDRNLQPDPADKKKAPVQQDGGSRSDD